MKVVYCDRLALPRWFRPIEIMQFYLRSISRVYDNIPRVIDDGFFGADTTAAVRAFQQEFGLPASGRIDYATWELIVAVYRWLEGLRVGSGEHNLGAEPGEIVILRPGSGDACLIRMLQAALRSLAARYDNMADVAVTGVYDEATAAAVADFQRLAGLADNGLLDRRTWNELLRFFTGCDE